MTNPFLEMLARREFFVAPGAYDGLTAHLIRERGFPAAYMSGAAVAASLGVPDIGLASSTEFISRARVLRSSLGATPLIADADTGFGGVQNVVRTAAEYARAGVNAIQLEDQHFPKRCGHLEGKRVVAKEEFADVLAAVVEAVEPYEMAVIARTDAIAVTGFEDALDRIAAYAEAGAHVVFVDAPETLEQIRAIPTSTTAPAMFNSVPNGKTPDISLEEVRDAGYAFSIVPLAALAPAMEAIVGSLDALSAESRLYSGWVGPDAIFTAVGLKDWEKIRLADPDAV